MFKWLDDKIDKYFESKREKVEEEIDSKVSDLVNQFQNRINEIEVKHAKELRELQSQLETNCKLPRVRKESP